MSYGDYVEPLTYLLFLKMAGDKGVGYLSSCFSRKGWSVGGGEVLIALVPR